MDANLGRRRFLQASSALGLGASLVSSGAITRASASELVVSPEAVQFRPEIEPVVRWIEETPRDRVFDVAVGKLKEGLSYRDLMAGLFLAGVRNVQPRPVGFKFHAVMVINSAHLLGQTAAVEDRLLPLFWALDNFKNSQEQDVKEGDWTLAKVDEPRLPSAGQAKQAFIVAMEAWDVDAADAAVASLCRNSGAAEAMEPLWRYGLRCQRDIGHKAIYAMQCWRTLQAIGWANAEPVLRSLAYAQLDLGNDKTRAPAGPYDANLENAKRIREGWQSGRPDPGATQSLVESLRTASPEDSSRQAVEILNRGVSPDAVWDAVVLAGGELMIRNPSIVSLHAVTAANALHFLYNASGDDTNRKLAVLQAVGWIPAYRARSNGGNDAKIDKLDPVDPDAKGRSEAVAEIFATIDSDRNLAARKALGYLARGGDAEDVYAVGRRMIFHKGRDSHDYKFGAAAWEEHILASDPRWRGPLLASSIFKFPGAATGESPLMRRAAEALKRI